MRDLAGVGGEVRSRSTSGRRTQASRTFSSLVRLDRKASGWMALSYMIEIQSMPLIPCALPRAASPFGDLLQNGTRWSGQGHVSVVMVRSKLCVLALFLASCTMIEWKYEVLLRQSADILPSASTVSRISSFKLHAIRKSLSRSLTTPKTRQAGQSSLSCFELP